MESLGIGNSRPAALSAIDRPEKALLVSDHQETSLHNTASARALAGRHGQINRKVTLILFTISSRSRIMVSMILRSRKIMPVLKNRHCLCLVAFLLSAQASAQDSADAIADCARISSTGDRILCLENALREGSDEKAAESVDSGKPLAQTADEPAEPSLAVGTAVESGEVVADLPSTKDEIGAEQVLARTSTAEDRDSDLASVTDQLVENYRIVPYERIVVELENGQIWRQIKGDTQRFSVSLRKNQTVDITESRFGGYQLRLNEMRRTIRVERIK